MLKVINGKIHLDGKEIPFRIGEFIPAHIIQRFGDSALYWFMDIDTIRLAYFTRMWFDAPMSINMPGHERRGFRPPDSGVGASLSQHQFGRAYDFNIQGMTAQQTYKEVMDNQGAFMDAGLTTVENIAMTPTWNHHDIRYTGINQLFIVNPK